MLKPIRPQVMVALITLGGLAAFGLHTGNLSETHLAAILGGITGIVGTLIALDKEG